MQLNAIDASIKTLTADALSALENQEFYKAQSIFRSGAKRYPHLITLNNLGVFYINEGLELSGGRVRNAKKLGEHYLFRAEKLGQSFKNLVAIGNQLFTEGEYHSASEYLSKACELHVSSRALNNLGSALYFTNDMGNAYQTFKTALEFCTNEDVAEIWPSTLFSLFYHDKKKCINLLKKTKIYPTQTELEQFQLLYLCGDLHAAERRIKDLESKYFIELDTFAMILDCLIKLGKDEDAKQYLSKQIKARLGYEYNTATEIKHIKRLFIDSNFRYNLISSFRYIPPLLKECYYIGCEKAGHGGGNLG